MSRFDLTDLLSHDAVVSVAASAAPPPALAGAGGGVAHDGASSVDQLMLWQPAIRSADADMLFEKQTLDARSRDMMRNDGYVAGGAQVLKDSVVGEQFRLSAKPSSLLLFGAYDPDWEDEASEEIEAKFGAYAESDMCWPDAQRVNTLTGLVRLAIAQHVGGGEVLASAEWQDDGRPFASNMLMIDPDRLSTPHFENRIYDWRIRSGIERTKTGAPIAYWIRNTHPSDGYNKNANTQKWTRVKRFNSWGRMQILHIYDTLRPDQTRGVSTMSTALLEMRMLRHFRKVELQRAVIAASYAATMETDYPWEAAQVLGVGADSADPYVSGAQNWLMLQAEYNKAAKNLHVDGARIPTLPPNTKLKIQNPGAASPAGADFEASMLRYIATALNVSYEELSRDYTRTNYSSARASIGKSLQGMRPRKRMVADRTANFLYRLWMEEALNYGDLECFRRPRTPSFYDGQNADHFCSAEWIGAGQGQIDPLKETQASLLRVKGGLSTQEYEIARAMGGNWRQVKRQIAREKAMDEALDIPSVYDQDTDQVERSLTATERDGDDGR